MTTPRTMYSVTKAAERAGEKLYEQRRRRAEAARKAAEAKAAATVVQPAADATPESSAG